MTSSEQPETLFEARFAEAAERRFRAEIRRSRRLAEWAADMLELEGQKRDVYVVAVVKSEFEPGGVAALLSRLRTDLKDHATAEEIAYHSDRLMAEELDDGQIHGGQTDREGS